MSLDETLIAAAPLARPNPGRRAVADATAADQSLWDTMCAHRLRPLVAAAVPLLDLCVRIKSSPAPMDVEGLRLAVLREIDKFERRIAPQGLAPRAVRACKYALSATVDDIVLSTPWGSHSVWTTRSMVGTLFSETWGGDRFFDLMTQLKKDPAVNVDLLELLYYCLSLGFEGKTRIAARGASEHAQLRDDVHRLIRASRGDFERDISPHWRGITTGQRKFAGVPIWVVMALAAGLLTLLYAGLSFALNARSDVVFNQLAALPPAGVVTLVRATPAVPPPVIMTRRDQLDKFLAPEISEGLVTVAEDAATLTVTIRSAGMFDSGSATLNPEFVPLMKRIGLALNDQPGNVVVVGHTDAQPIHSFAFPSNFDLSLARAVSVAHLIQSQMTEPMRVSEDGKGASEPIATDDTPEGREQNRRTDVVINKTQ